MSFASTRFGIAAAVTFLVASAARPVSANDCAIHGTCCFGPKPAAKHWKPSSIEAVFERVTVADGGLRRWQIRRSLEQQATPIAACFEGDDAIGATVSVTFVVGASGQVIRADATSKQSRVATCVAAAWLRRTFPASRDLSLTQVTVSVRARR